jgi:hypothetical protein
VAGRIPASADCEVDHGRRLGQHSEVGSSIGVSRGGVAHRRGLEEQRLASVVGLVGSGCHGET